jgi:acetyltransferase-like isoleucine patch superfamily enzyme
MNHYIIPEAFEIPSFDHGKNIADTIKHSSKRRKMNPVHFTFRKIRNIILYGWSYSCPFNSWRIAFNRGRGVHIGKNCYIGTHVSIDNAYPEMVFIEDNCAVNQGTTIIAHTNALSSFKDIVNCQVNPVVIKSGSMVAINCTILPGVRIGVHSIVSAGSVVMSKVPPYTMVVGNPAKKWVDLKKISD